MLLCLGARTVRALCFLSYKNPNQHWNTGSVCFNSRRSFVCRKVLRLPSFIKTQKAFKRKAGLGADKFRAVVKERVDEQSSVFDPYDVDSFIYLASDEDVPLFPTLISRTEYYPDDDSFYNNPEHLISGALKRCILLNDVETALKLYPLVDTHTMYYSSILAVLDLLYENGKYEECLQLALDRVGPGDIRSSWFYLTSILSAYQLDRVDALNSAITLLYKMKEARRNIELFDEDGLDIYLERQYILVAHYCIKQNRVTTALSLLAESRLNVLSTVNIKVLAFLKTGNTARAVSTLKQYEYQQRTAGTEGSRTKPIICYDVYLQLRDKVKELPDPNNREAKWLFGYLSTKAKFSQLVHRGHLSDHILNNVTSSVRKAKQAEELEREALADRGGTDRGETDRHGTDSIELDGVPNEKGDNG